MWLAYRTTLASVYMQTNVTHVYLHTCMIHTHINSYPGLRRRIVGHGNTGTRVHANTYCTRCFLMMLDSTFGARMQGYSCQDTNALVKRRGRRVHAELAVHGRSGQPSNACTNAEPPAEAKTHCRFAQPCRVEGKIEISLLIFVPIMLVDSPGKSFDAGFVHPGNAVMSKPGICACVGVPQRVSRTSVARIDC